MKNGTDRGGVPGETCSVDRRDLSFACSSAMILGTLPAPALFLCECDSIVFTAEFNVCSWQHEHRSVGVQLAIRLRGTMCKYLACSRLTMPIPSGRFPSDLYAS